MHTLEFESASRRRHAHDEGQQWYRRALGALRQQAAALNLPDYQARHPAFCCAKGEPERCGGNEGRVAEQQRQAPTATGGGQHEVLAHV